MLPEYALEFQNRLRACVSDRLEVLPGGLGAEHPQRCQRLQTLYGKEVLPACLRLLLRGALGVLHNCVGTSGRSSGLLAERVTLVADISATIGRLCLRGDEKPITIR